MKALRDEVLARANEGLFNVHPLHDTATGECSCGGKTINPDCCPGKHPRLYRYPQRAQEAANDPKAIEKWWKKYPSANVGGIVRPGYTVIDIDPRHGGDLALAALEMQHGSLDTVTTLTASGGSHRYLRVPAGFVPTKKKYSLAGNGLELLCPGWNVVLVGSVVNGVTYQYAPGKSPDEIAIAELPQWIIDIISPPTKPPQNHTKRRNTRGKREIPTSVPDGTRHHVVPSLAGSYINYGLFGEALVEALTEVDQHCIPPLGSKEIQSIATSMQKTHARKPQTNEEKIQNRNLIGEVLSEALATEWKGKVENSEFAILFAILATGYGSGSLTPDISFRQIAELGCLSLDTVCRRLPNLLAKNFCKISASYRSQVFSLLEQKKLGVAVTWEDIAAVKTRFEILPIPLKVDTSPTPPPPLCSSSLFALFCFSGNDVLFSSALGVQAIKIIALLLRCSFSSCAEISRIGHIPADAVEKVVGRMVKIEWVRKVNGWLSLRSMAHIERTLVKAAKDLGTYKKGQKRRRLHAIHRKGNADFLRAYCKNHFPKKGEAEDHPRRVERLASEKNERKFSPKKKGAASYDGTKPPLLVVKERYQHGALVVMQMKDFVGLFGSLPEQV